jgi:hypothetical protein
MTWVTLNVPDAYTRRALGFVSERGLPVELNIGYEYGREGLVKTAELLWEQETSGTPAVTYIPPEPDWEPPYVPPPGDIPEPPPTTEGTGFGTLYAAVNAAIGKTPLLSATSPAYTNKIGGITGTVYDIALDPHDPELDILYATSTTGFWKSTDGGDNWSSIRTAAQLDSAYSTIKPGGAYINGRKIMASINVPGFVAFIHQKWDLADGDRMALLCTITTDGGTTWNYNAIADGSVNTTQIRPFYGGADYLPHLVGGEVVMGVAVKSQQGNGRFYYSVDSGVNWTLVDVGNFGSGGDDGGIVVHYPFNDNLTGQYVFAIWQSEGLYRSTDGGDNWTKLNSFYTNAKRHGIESWTQDRQRMFHWRSDNTLWLSDDAGDNWSQAAASGLSGNVRAAGGFPYVSGQFYVLTSTGIFVSIDRGATFIDKTGDWSFGFTTAVGNGALAVVWIAE